MGLQVATGSEGKDKAMIIIISGAVVLAILGSALVVWFKDRRYSESKNLDVKRIIQTNLKFAIITLTVFLGVSLLGAWLCIRSGSAYVPLCKELLLIYGLFLIAFIDFKEHIIPNSILITLLVARIGFLIYESVVAYDILQTVLLLPLLGALIGGGIILVAMLISRKGVGMGDVKMFLIIGLFTGSALIIPTLFYTILISALVGLGLVVTRKAKLSDAMPMAPFACVGVVANMILSYWGGLV
ncbi:MAG: A24 family peptidase [Peptococcaceae bacterium]|nr:A24 family peptidase [Peptococcaceae bacterium]